MTASLLAEAGRERVEALAAQMLERERWPREQLLEYQEERLRKIVQHAVANSPYYRQAIGMWETATSRCRSCRS